MKIYTRTGDKGETGLFGGQRVPKTHVRIEAYGTIDELNANLGLVISNGSDNVETLQTIQGDLMILGSHLATPYSKDKIPDALPNLRNDSIKWLEDTIDTLDKDLPELKNFILPGGSTAASELHVARTICRRAERRVIELSKTEYVNPEIITYLNRLSDCLFTLARFENKASNQTETTWKA